ncbi:hypothetical protein J6590_096979, partial [Homalodisca vitripennis]
MTSELSANIYLCVILEAGDVTAFVLQHKSSKLKLHEYKLHKVNYNQPIVARRCAESSRISIAVDANKLLIGGFTGDRHCHYTIMLLTVDWWLYGRQTLSLHNYAVTTLKREELMTVLALLLTQIN